MTNLCETWLRGAAAECRRKARKARRAHETLTDQSTSYADALNALAEAHASAADVYASWQREPNG